LNNEILLPQMAGILKKSGDDWAFMTCGIIPTRQMESESKQFCIGNLIPFGFI